MGRILFQYVLPIVLPTALYLAWLAAEHRRIARAGVGQKPRWQDAPWLWLGAIGVFFAGMVAVATALFGGAGIEGVYVPPRLENGQITAGHVEPRRPAR